MYYGGEKPSISQFFKCFSFGLDQALLSKKITSMLKINAIRQWIAFLSKLGVIFSFYIVSFKFPGIPRLVLGNSRSQEWKSFGKSTALTNDYSSRVELNRISTHHPKTTHNFWMGCHTKACFSSMDSWEKVWGMKVPSKTPPGSSQRPHQQKTR